MANETNNETATNETSEGNLTAILDTVEESGLLDTLMDEPLLMALAAVILGMGAYIAYTVPAVLALLETKLETIDDSKTIHYVDVFRTGQIWHYALIIKA